MTTDDQIQLALRWNIDDISENQLMNTAKDWKNDRKVKMILTSFNSHIFSLISD